MFLLSHRHDQGVEQAQRCRHGVHEGDHVAAHQERCIGQLIKGRHLTVGDGHHFCAAAVGKLHSTDRQLRVTGEADTHDHIARANADHLLEDLAAGHILHQRNVGKNQMEIKVQITCQIRRGAHTENIDVAGVEQLVHRTVKCAAVQLIDRRMNTPHVPLHNAAQDVLMVHLLPGDLDTLDGSQTAAHQFLQRFLHLGVAFITQLGGKAHYRGLTDLRGLAQLGSRHKGGLIVIVQNILRNTALAFGKALALGLDHLQHILFHALSLPFSFCTSSLVK